jgi:hypothetical protein
MTVAMYCVEMTGNPSLDVREGFSHMCWVKNGVSGAGSASIIRKNMNID